jgi:hypothetical protein
MSLLRTLAAAPLALSLVACTTDAPLGAWTPVATVPDATMAGTRDAAGTDPLLVIPISDAAGSEVASYNVTTGELLRGDLVAAWAAEHGTAPGIVTYFDDDLPQYRSVLVDLPYRTYVFGAHQGVDGHGAAVIVNGIGPIADVPEAMPRPTGAGAIGERPFASGETGLHAYDRRSGDWSSVDLPEGGPWSTTSVGGVAYAVGDTGGGVAIMRLDVE